MHRPAQRLTRILVCAATATVIVGAAGCSSDSEGGDAKEGGPSASASSSTAPSASSAPPAVEKAKFSRLPNACEALPKKVREDLVPNAKSGKAGSSNEADSRGTCSWSSLDNNGVDGSQFRWLTVSLLRLDSDQSRGSGEELAREYLTKQVTDAKATAGAKKLTATPLSGAGDEAQTIAYDLKKKEGTFKQQTVVARVENVVVTVDYNGAGLAGDATPGADALTKAAQRAAKEVVSAVVAANDTAADAAEKDPKDDKGTEDGKDAKDDKGDAGEGAGMSMSPSKS
ncbi:DUF3558 family protein [Streptomyces sp. NPDC002490]|uniref:DUF3558 family protein n=1 Tax=Streptomyces sp. NPDC002490 TaxID=3154416 RepID=UPI00331E2DDB